MGKSFDFKKILIPIAIVVVAVLLIVFLANEKAGQEGNTGLFAASVETTENTVTAGFGNGKAVFSENQENEPGVFEEFYEAGQFQSVNTETLGSSNGLYMSGISAEGNQSEFFLTGNSNGTSGTFQEGNQPGVSGTSGTSGVAGTTGTGVTSGVAGAIGTAGTSGTSGIGGATGTSGVAGASGTAGTSGVAGASGTAGTSGTSGIGGATGTSGVARTSGVAGASGTSASGSSGAAGGQSEISLIESTGGTSIASSSAAGRTSPSAATATGNQAGSQTAGNAAETRQPVIAAPPTPPPPSPPPKPVPNTMELIRGGAYYMGSPVTEEERIEDEVQHLVTIKPFYIGKHEVTQREYEEVMGTNPSYFKGANLPVESVNWYDAIEYCNRLSLMDHLTPVYRITGFGRNITVTWDESANGYRLPTEEEWEYACRAGTTTSFNTGSRISRLRANYFAKGTVTVGSYPANLWGLHDMHGNVAEWCWDLYHDYVFDAQTSNNQDARRVVRGGSWITSTMRLRSAFRDHVHPTQKTYGIGFRVVRNPL